MYVVKERFPIYTNCIHNIILHVNTLLHIFTCSNFMNGPSYTKAIYSMNGGIVLGHSYASYTELTCVICDRPREKVP